MNNKKYKSVVVDKDTYDLINAMADEQDRSKSATLKRLVEGYCGYECDEVNIDTRRKSGGTNRLLRMIEDLKYLKENSTQDPERNPKEWIISKDEEKSLDILIDTVQDIVNMS